MKFSMRSITFVTIESRMKCCVDLCGSSSTESPFQYSGKSSRIFTIFPVGLIIIHICIYIYIYSFFSLLIEFSTLLFCHWSTYFTFTTFGYWIFRIMHVSVFFMEFTNIKMILLGLEWYKKLVVCLQTYSNAFQS